MAVAIEGLLLLPTELLAHVCSFLPPEDVLSFALSSRACAIGAADILRGLQNIFLEYQTINDEDPVKLLQTLRIVLREEFRAGCIRHIEIGDVKSCWQHWSVNETRQDELPDAVEHASIANLNVEPENYHQTESNQWQLYYTYEELEEYRRLLRAYIFRNFTANTLSNEHVSMLRDGQDDALKLLLIALSPKLESLTFYALHPSKSNRTRLCPHPLYYSFLAHDQDIRQIFNPETRWFARSSPRENPWPPGFQSLRKVSVCAPLPANQPSEQFHTRPTNIVGLFWLPNIETLELYNLRQHRGGDAWIDVKIGCSSVQNLRLESCQIKVSTMLRLITASRALRQLTIKKCGRNLAFVREWVGEWYADSLGR